MRKNEIAIQRAYYARTAHAYDTMHVSEDDAHTFALGVLSGYSEWIDAQSVLDIGSGTGRAILALKRARPNMFAQGIEPSPDLRAVGYAKRLSQSELIDGDAMALAFEDKAFDIVCEFGALHHLPDPARAVGEMLRVARRAVFISDSNNFGNGSLLGRIAKQTFHAFGLWPVVDFLKTGGRGYMLGEGDGLAYSYSVFSDLAQIRKACARAHVFDVGGQGAFNLYRDAATVAILAIKAD